MSYCLLLATVLRAVDNECWNRLLDIVPYYIHEYMREISPVSLK